MTKHLSLSSLQHPLVKHLVKLRTDSGYRQEHQALVLEGLKPVQELCKLTTKILYTPAYAAFAAPLLGEKWEVTDAILQKVSGMSNPEGIVAEIRMPPYAALGNAKRVLALDGISDPGNMGTLLRTALALGWEVVYLLPGCCDPYNEKALRAGRGAHFKMAIAKGSFDQLQEWVDKEGAQALVADLDGDCPDSLPASPRLLLVLGNEARGASDEVFRFCRPVSIPMPGEMESLNVAVAGGILLYLFSKRISP